MSDPTPAEGNATAAPKKPNLLVVGLVGLNLALIAAAGAYFFLTRDAHAAAGGHGEEDAEEAGDEGDEEGDEEDAEGDEEDDEEHELGPLVEFESMVVNLRAPTPDHYLKVTFQLEVRGEEDLEHVESHMVVYRDQVLAYLVNQEVASVVGPEGGAHLRAELLGIARHVFGRRLVRNIYFTELLVQ